MELDLLWLNKDDILRQISWEKQLSSSYFESKREQFRERIKLINWQAKWKDKVNINIASSQINTLIALSYQDELTVKFQGRSFEDYEVADNLENLARFDTDEMNMDWKNYQKEFDRLFYWYSIRTFDDYDVRRNVPMYTVQDPLTWYADPTPTWYTAQDFRFHWFETEITMQELKNESSALVNSGGFYNLDDLQSTISTEREKNLQYRNEADKLDFQKDTTANAQITLYNHYTVIEWEKYFVVCDSDCKNILKFIKLEAVTVEEKADPSLIPFPIVINYYRPSRDNPCGYSVMDYVEDKQRASSKLFNLQLIKATKEALWGDFVYDVNKIKNRADLQKPSITSRYIWINLKSWENIGNVVQEVAREKLTQDVEMMRNSINREVQNSTWIDWIIQWVRWDRSITARESQTIQQNANLNLALNNKVNSWGEKAFWKLWYRCYKEYFSSSAEKVVRLSNWFGSNVMNFKKVDFITTNDIDIDIINKSDEDAKTAEEKLNIPNYQILLQDPTIEKINKVFINRHILRISGTPANLIKQMIPETYEEQDAKEQVWVLNHNIEIKDIDVQTDQATYLAIYKRWLPTDAMKKITAKREAIYKEQLKQKTRAGQQADWMPMQQGGWGWWIGWALNNSMANSQSAQREWWQSASIADIAW